MLITMLVPAAILTLLTMPLCSCDHASTALISAAKAQISAFGSGLGMFRTDNGYFPQGTNGLIYLVQEPPGATNWRQYFDSIPLDPWSHPYIYECPGRHNPQSYDLISMGPDGRVGGGDDIGNWKPN
jgi:general secretion pathway protein G